MGILKVDGKAIWESLPREERMNADDPEVRIYADGRVSFKYYAARFLALTALTDPDVIEQIRTAAASLEGLDGRVWTAADAERLIAAGGMPPTPSHAQIAPYPGQMILLVRAAQPGVRNVRRLTYATGSTQPTITMARRLSEVGIKIPAGTCLEVPVRLAEDGNELMVALLLRQSRSRSLQEDHTSLES